MSLSFKQKCSNKLIFSFFDSVRTILSVHVPILVPVAVPVVIPIPVPIAVLALDNALGFSKSENSNFKEKLTQLGINCKLFHPQPIPVAEPVPVSNHVPFTVPIPDFFAFLFLYLFSL